MRNYNQEVIETEDGRKWIYDAKHHEWVEVTPPRKDPKKLIFVPL